jgi:hypothetical protein
VTGLFYFYVTVTAIGSTMNCAPIKEQFTRVASSNPTQFFPRCKSIEQTTYLNVLWGSGLHSRQPATRYSGNDNTPRSEEEKND